MASPSTESTLDALPVDRDALVWTVLAPAVVVLPLAALAATSVLWEFVTVGVGLLSGLAFGVLGDDNRSESMVSGAYIDASHDGGHANPRHALRTHKVLRFTGGVATGCLLAFVVFGFLV